MPIKPEHQWMYSRETIASWRTQYDLPPAWDGYEIIWEPLEKFTYSLSTAVLHCEKDDPCENCGDDTGNHFMTRGRIPMLHRRLSKQWEKRYWNDTVMHLLLWRCKTCSLDTVYSLFNDSWWELDETDYRPVGSLHNEGVPDLFESLAEKVRAEDMAGKAQILDFVALGRQVKKRRGSS